MLMLLLLLLLLLLLVMVVVVVFVSVLYNLIIDYSMHIDRTKDPLYFDQEKTTDDWGQNTGIKKEIILTKKNRKYYI